MIAEAERRRRYDRHAELLRAAAGQDGAPIEAALTAHLSYNATEIEERIERLASPDAS